MDIFALYQFDPGSAYDRTKDELNELIAHFGEDDILIDAILVVDGQTDESRLEALGLPPSDSWMLYNP